MTHKMRRSLIEDLRYTRSEVNRMTPERAKAIISGRVSRPSSPPPSPQAEAGSGIIGGSEGGARTPRPYSGGGTGSRFSAAGWPRRAAGGSDATVTATATQSYVVGEDTQSQFVLAEERDTEASL